MNKGTARLIPLWAIGVAALLQFIDRRPSRTFDAKRSQSRQNLTETSIGNNLNNSGRNASGPMEIPARGWKDILVRIYYGISEDRILAISAGVTFYVLLALFPGIAGLIALYSLYADANTISQHLNTLSDVLPEGALQIIGEQIQRLVAQPAQRLGFATILGLAISLWSANGGMKAIFDALNVMNHENEKRSFIRLNATSLLFTAGAILFILLALAAMTVLPLLLNYLGLPQATELLIRIFRWPILLLIVSFAIALIYRYGPSRDKPQWRWITPGSVFAAIGWLCVSLLFSWYTENFGKYNETYGSLGAVIGFMTWMWLSTIVVLAGAKLNAEMEHQTKRDSTAGHPQPIGKRGAQMADTVGRTAS